MPDFEINAGPAPCAFERIVSMHGSYYGEHWGFGPYFEVKVSSELAEFLERFDADRDGLWTADAQGRVEGAIAIDGSRASAEGAHLRWFIVSESLRGKGAGSALIRTAMSFCREKRYPRVYLWTFAGLDDAKRLYDREGFRVVQEQLGSQWGTEVLEQKLEYEPGGAA